MYTDRRNTQYTVGAPRAAKICSVLVHLAAFLGSAYAWQAAGLTRPDEGPGEIAIPAGWPGAIWGSDPLSIFGQRAAAPAEQRTVPDGPRQVVADAIARIAPAAKEPAGSGARMCSPAARVPLFPADQPEKPGLITYDTVLVGSAGTFLFPGTEGLLSGSAVYTVYLRAGRRDWVLQFCAREGDEDRQGALEPPRPVHAVRPELTLAPEVEYMVIHGRINAEGRFENLAIIGEQPLRPDPDTLLRSLSEWELRPAAKDGRALPVDVVLIVPNGSAGETSGTQARL